jgi:serine/threonine protein kinase
MNTLRDRLVGLVLLGSSGSRYRLVEHLGEDDLGWAFRGTFEARSAEPVRVLVFRPDAVGGDALARFERDACTLRTLGQAAQANPHIVRFLDLARVRIVASPPEPPLDLTFAVFEFVAGSTLDRVLFTHRGQGLSLDRTRRVAGDVASALSELHAHGILHCGLIPANVVVTVTNGRELAKLGACGLPKSSDIALGAGGGRPSSALGYSAPERFERGARRVGVRSDVFSFAAIVFEMLAGTRAFPHGPAENPLVVVSRLLNGPRPSILRSGIALPPELVTRSDLLERIDVWLASAMAAEPADRPSSVSEFWAAIDPLLRRAYDDPSTFGTAATLASERPQTSPEALPHEPFATARQSIPESPDEKRLPAPSAWTWRLRVEPTRPGLVRAACFDPGGESAVALSSEGLLYWAESGWTRLPDIAGLDAGCLRGFAWLGAGELVAFGARGLVGRLVPGMSFEAWALSRYELTLHGAHVDRAGAVVTLVGERPAVPTIRGGVRVDTVATVVQLSRGRPTMVADATGCSCLRGVTRLRNGTIVACGDFGAIARVEPGGTTYSMSVCAGHLRAISASHDAGAVTVGTGGHALSLSATLEAQLEAVQTTRDIRTLAMDPAGTAWAGSDQARLLRRSAGSWVRISGELGLHSSVVALFADTQIVRAVCDDGAVLEGTAGNP